MIQEESVGSRYLLVIGSLLCAVLAAACGGGSGSSDTTQKPLLTVAAASDLKFALDELLEEYRAAHPDTDVRVIYGSSGNFFAQIENQAPFDVYFSADVEYPRALAEKGLALGGKVDVYAVGRIVVWVPNRIDIPVEELGVHTLLHPSIGKVAIANPQHAPYGRAAMAALEHSGVAEAVKPKLVLGENIAQTAQFVQTGGADAGVLALALVVAPQMEGTGRFSEFPLESYPTMVQGVMVLATTKFPRESTELVDFVLSGHGREVLRRYGFHLPE